MARHVRSIPLPAAWPAYVRLGGGIRVCAMARMRLPTEAEHQRAAYGTSSSTERPFPWGDEEPGPDHGLFDFAAWTRIQPDCIRQAAAPGVWTIWSGMAGSGRAASSSRSPASCAVPSYPEYSADFFDGEHFVMKGASPSTARELLRPTFRNWFRARYPLVYATFRCVKGKER